LASEGYATVEFGIINDRFCIDLHEPAVPSPALEPIRMPQPSGKLFVPDQALYWLDGRAKPEKSDHPSNPVNKRDWLQTHNLPEFDEETKDTEKTPWTRIDRIEARIELLKNLGPAGDTSKRKLLCFTASAGVGKSIALQQIAYLRSLDPDHLVIRYHFSELPTNVAHFWLAGMEQRSLIQSQLTRPLVLALLHTVFPVGEDDPNWPELSDGYEQEILLFIKSKIHKGHVTLIVDGLDEFHALDEGATEGNRKARALALKSLLNKKECRDLHCVVAGRPYSIFDDNWADLFESKEPNGRTNGGSEWEFCLAALFTEAQSKRYLGPRYDKLGSLQAQTPLTPRHLEVIRTLPANRFAKLHSLACVYWEMLQASLEKDLNREGNVGPFERLNVPVTKEQYIGYLAALASITMKRSKDLKSLDLAEYEVALQKRVLKIPSWKIGKESTEEKIKHIKGLNSSSIEFNYLRQNNSQVVWKDRTVMDFFSALWLVRYSTDKQREVICKQVPRRGEKQLDENRRDLWTFIAGMPFDAFEKFEVNVSRDERWVRLVSRLFQPFTDAKRPTQLMYIAWEELKRGVKAPNRKKSLTKVMDSFTNQYDDLRKGACDESKIINEDLENQFKLIPPPKDGWSNAETSLRDEKREAPILVSGPYEVCAYPVTRRLYALFDRSHETVFKSLLSDFSPEPRCPAICISWYDATMFAAWASVRLLKEAEWEYACRANIREDDPESGPLSENFWKGDPKRMKLEDHAWIGKNSNNRTWPVDAKDDGSHTNPFGLVDTLGNVWEWTASNYVKGGVSRVLRGGSFDFSGRLASASYRHHGVPTFTNILIGFRVARAP